MKLIKGNIVELATKGAILHQVNCQNVMGSGVAKSIYEKYPIVKEEYHEYCNTAEKPKDLLGDLHNISVTEDLEVFNSFSQLYFGNSSRTGLRYTNEELLSKNILSFDKYCKYNNINGYVPLLIGCGLAGGNAETIYKVLEKN